MGDYGCSLPSRNAARGESSKITVSIERSWCGTGPEIGMECDHKGSSRDDVCRDASWVLLFEEVLP
jgi:hypothetical protein